MRATEQCCPVLLNIMQHKVVLRLEVVAKVLRTVGPNDHHQFPCFPKWGIGPHTLSFQVVLSSLLSPPIQRYFCKGYDRRGKADLSKTYWNLKGKMSVTAHFSEKIRQKSF